MTRLAAGGRATQPGILCRYWYWRTPRRGVLRQHIAKVLAGLAAFTDDYPDAEQEGQR